MYDHQIWQGGVIPCHEELPLIKLLDPSMSHDILNTSYLHLHWTNGHQTWQSSDSCT